MRQVYLSFFLLACSIMLHAQTLTKSKFYTVSSWEMMLSGATIDNNGNDGGNIVRFSGVINGQNWLHLNVSKNVGFYIGNSIHNVGFIYDIPDSSAKKKFRTYNIGLPLGIKIGNMRDDNYLFAGYELELPFNYKEKTFVDERKTDKFSVWFSGRVPLFYHSLMIGYHFPQGIGLKFKYYLNGFFNQDYEGTDSYGNSYKPYSGFQANIFSFSLTVDLFKNTRFYYSQDNETDMKQTKLD